MRVELSGGKSSASKKAGLGCTILFLIPFFAIGIFTIGMGIKMFITGEGDKGQGTFLIGFGSIFAGVASLILVAVLFGAKSQKKRDAIKEQHPNEPWLWREDWATGRIRSSEKAGVVFIWFFAIFWNAVSMPSAFFGVREAIKKEDWAILFVLLFPLVGVGLLYWAIHATLRHLRYGVSTFEPAAMPGVIGGQLQGQVFGKIRLGPGHRMKVQLTNFHRYTSGSGKNRSTHYKVLWQEEKELGMEHLSLGMHGGSVIPIDFYVPRDCQETTVYGGEDGYLWRLVVSASVPGVDYGATFDIPVFVTAESDAPQARQLAERAEQQALELGPPSEISVRISPTPAGGTEYYWAPARRPLAAFIMTLVTAGFGVGLYFAITKGAPILVDIIVGLFGVIMGLLTLSMWTSSSRLILEHGRARVLNKFAGFGGWKEFAAPDIADVQPVVGSSSNDKAYYYIALKLSTGKSVRLGNGMEGQREAQWLAAQIKDQLKQKPW